MKLNNKTYDILKWISLYILPALATLYYAISEIWNIPFCEQVVGTISAIETFIGVAVGLSANEYKKD